MQETTTITPQPGQSTILTGDGPRYPHYDGGHRNHLDELIAREQAAGFRVDAQNAQTIVRDIKDTRFDLATSQGNHAAAAAVSACHTDQLVQGTSARTDSLVQSGFGVVHDRLCDTKSGIVGALTSGFKDEALADCKIGDEISDSKLFNAVQFKDQVIEANKNSAAVQTLVSTVGNAAQVLATSIGNAASVQATANYNGMTVQATNNYNGLTVQGQALAAAATVQVERVRAELESKIAAGNAAAVLLATQLDAQARREAAECCCETKELIRAQTALVLAQGTDFRMRDLEGRLNRIPTGVAITIPPGL